MGAPVNLGFETAGLAAGEAAGWTVTKTSSAIEIADYSGGVGPPQPVESFEAGWDGNESYKSTLVLDVDTTDALYSVGLVMPTPRVEDFERGWDGNENYNFDIGLSAAASYGSGLADVEDFESEWGNDNYVTDFQGVGIDLVEAVFDGALDAESFEEGWGNTSYYTDLINGVGLIEFAEYDGPYAPTDVEDFEEVLFDVTIVSVDTGTYRFTETPSGSLATDDSFYLKNTVGGSLPGGVFGQLVYWAGDYDGTEFYISLLPFGGGGTILTITSSGDPGIIAHADPARYWTSDYKPKSF